MTNQVVTVFGGSGFIGRYIVRDLAQAGWRIKVAVRRPNEAEFLRTAGNVGQIELIQANLRDSASVTRALHGADAAVNAVGIDHQSGHQTFDHVHAEGTAHIAEAARRLGVARLIHVSGLGVDPKSPSPFIRSKTGAETALRDGFPGAVVLRPSVVFGPEDRFFNRLAAFARFAPVLPVFGHARFQPVYVGDVAAAARAAIDTPASAGKVYELGGPRTYTLRELTELVLSIVDRKCLLLPMPVDLVKFKAWFLGLLPHPVLTVDQVRLMELDNVVTAGALGLEALGITPTAAESVLPTYLYRFRHRGLVRIRHSV